MAEVHAVDERRPHPRCLPGAIIVGGAHGSLALARSLGRRGIPVWFVTSDHPIAKASRYVSRACSWPGPHSDKAVGFLLELASRHDLHGWVLMAAADASMRLIAQHHALLSTAYLVTVPPWNTVRWAHDKRLMYQTAAALGIDHPRSSYPRDEREIEQLDCHFPVILKPAMREHSNPFTKAKAWRCNNRQELLSRYRAAANLIGTDGIVLQELIPGGGDTQFSCAGVWERGSPVAWMIARRTRQYPVEFGATSTFVETVERPEVEEATSRFLGSLGFSGLAEAEFKYDKRDGRYKLLDINPRAWTWNALGSIAGADFAYVLWRVATGQPMTPVRACANAAWMHAWRDILAACHEFGAGTLSPIEYFKSWQRPLVFAAFAKDDPLPGIIDLPLTLLRAVAGPIMRAFERRATSRLEFAPLPVKNGEREQSELVATSDSN